MDRIPFGQWKTRWIYHIKKSKISLQDSAVNLGAMTEVLDETVFRLERNAVFPVKSSEDDVLLGVFIQMDMDLTVVSRNGY